MITQAGPHCDVCGTYIIDGNMELFTMTAFPDQTLCCHDKCRPVAEEAFAAKDWRLLPPGPIRKAFEEHESSEAAN